MFFHSLKSLRGNVLCLFEPKHKEKTVPKRKAKKVALEGSLIVFRDLNCHSHLGNENSVVLTGIAFV